MNEKLTDTKLKKLKNAVKNKTRTTLRVSFKVFDGNDLPQELLLITRQKRSEEMRLMTICQLT